MHVYICIHRYLCMLVYIYAYIFTCRHCLYIPPDVWLHKYKHTYTYTNTNIHTHIFLHTSISACIQHLCMVAFIHIHMHTNRFMYVCACTYTSINAYIYKNTWKLMHAYYRHADSHICLQTCIQTKVSSLSEFPYIWKFDNSENEKTLHIWSLVHPSWTITLYHFLS